MSKLNVDEITSRVRRRINREDTPSGFAQLFFNLGDGWAIKLSQRNVNPYEEMKLAFDLQKRAARFGLGPEAGEMISLAINGKIYVGYTTQVADIVPSELQNKDEGAYQRYKVRHLAALPDTKMLLQEHLGIYMDDDKADNFSFIDGRHVMIDFGTESYHKVT